jgi:hypothetical protein
VTNNIIANNVAGWDGGGVSLEDSLLVNFINNTVTSNDSTASAGVLFNTLGAPLASSQSPGPTCASNCGTTSAPQPAGFVSLLNSPQLTSSFTTGAITCPAGHYAPSTSATNGTCTQVSYPLLANNIFWQNRSFYIGVGSLGTGTQNQQNVVTLYPTLNQTSTGQCVSGASYWDIGVRGDTGPTNHAVYTLNPLYSILTNTSGYDSSNLNSNPNVVSQYCNGSRVPPENGGMGYQVPPGISDATVPNPIFNLTPAATVDEGNNWINISWGPLALTNPVTNATLGNYGLASGSPAIDKGTSSPVAGVTPPPADFFGTSRSDGNDIGAVELIGAAPIMVVGPNPLSFGNVSTNTTKSLPVTVSNAPTAGANLILAAPTITGGNSATKYTFTTTCATGTPGLAPGSSCTITVTFGPTAILPAPQTATLNVNATNATAVAVPLSGTGVLPTYTIAPGPATGHNFGNELVGTQSTPPFQFTVTNTSTNGGELWLTGNPAISGTFASQFLGAFRAGDTCTAATHLAASASCTFSVVFAPTSTGNKGTGLVSPGARVDVTHEAGAVNTGVLGSPVWGTGTTVAFSGPTPSLLNGSSTTHSGTVTVTNNSGGTITLAAAPTVTKVGTAGGLFSITGGTCTNGATVTAGSNCTIIVQYNPNGTGTTTATANVSISDTFAGGTGTATQTSANFTAN